MHSSENKAIPFLREKGFEILARNYKFFAVEVDVLARRYINEESLYCFVEVKQVRRKHYFSGYNIIGHKQYMRYRLAMEQWHATYKPLVNVSIALLVLDEDENVLDFIENLMLSKD